MKKLRREKNPLNTYDVAEGIAHDKSLVGPEWGSRRGNETGYNARFGAYGSAARGWVDRPHDRNEDLQDKVLREHFFTEHYPYGDGGRENYQRDNTLPSTTFAGRGPKSYQRTDETLYEEICEYLMRDPNIDATEIQVQVEGGDVTLTGTVSDRRMKYWSEELIEQIRGVRNLENQIKVDKTNQNTYNS